jgi:hypothetical protein
MLSCGSFGAEKGGAVIGGTLLNMAVFGAMIVCVSGISFILPRTCRTSIALPQRLASPARADCRHCVRDHVLPAAGSICLNGVYVALLWYVGGVITSLP